MNKALLAAALLFIGCACHAATIEEIISPTQFVVSSAGQRTILDIEGVPVYACGMKPFQSWAQRLTNHYDAASNNGIAGLSGAWNKSRTFQVIMLTATVVSSM